MLEALPAIQAPALDSNGVSIRALDGQTIISIATRSPPKNWPEPGNVRSLKGGRLMRLAADQCFWLGDSAPKAPAKSYVTDQSDSWAVVELAGASTIAVLERLIPLDVASWSAGSVGRTSMHHLAVIVLKTGNDSFVLLSPRSSADDFWHALSSAVSALE